VGARGEGDAVMLPSRPRSDFERCVSLMLWLWVLMLTAAAVANFCVGRGHAQPSSITSPPVPRARQSVRRHAITVLLGRGEGSALVEGPVREPVKSQPTAGRRAGRVAARSCDGATVAAARDVVEIPFATATALLAQVCEFEADRREVDCAAIWWVAVKRARSANVEPLTMLLRYSTLWRTRSARARRIQASAPPAALLELAGRLLRDEVPDPCPRATHWGSAADGARGRMVLARCSVRTANRFYAVTRGRRRNDR
jgi:hypothetical protein